MTSLPRSASCCSRRRCSRSQAVVEQRAAGSVRGERLRWSAARSAFLRGSLFGGRLTFVLGERRRGRLLQRLMSLTAVFPIGAVGSGVEQRYAAAGTAWCPGPSGR